MRVVFLIGIVSVLVACRSTRPIQSAISKRDSAAENASKPKSDSAQTVEAVLQALDSNRITFQTFTSKVNIDYRGSDGKNYNLNANLRMQRDSAIWISVNAVLGIEALRVLITKDSVKLIDKLNKTYQAHSISYLQTTTALPLDLPTLQDLIIGNPVFLDSTVIGYTKSPGNISLLLLGKLFKNLITVSASDTTVQHIKLDDANPARARTADLSYADYERKKEVPFATKRVISVSEKKKLDIRLDFKQYDFNEPVSFPFSIPKNFEAS
jgi:hypothetical protein